MSTTTAAAGSEDYRDEVMRVEPHGTERIPDEARHGKPWSVFTLWYSSNVEFTTLVTGVLATAAFGLGFLQATLAIVVGNVLGALFLGLMSARGPQLGVPQMIQSRSSFGYFGNYVPGGLNFIAGCSWFAVNTVLGVFAMEYLIHTDFLASLIILSGVQILIATYGHNLIHTVERWLVVVLTAIFVMVSVYGFGHANLDAGFNAHTAGPLGFSGGFILTVAIAFSYCLGWVPYASDYTRYLPRATSQRAVFGYAASSLLVSCVWMEVLGAAVGTTRFVAVPTDLVANLMPHAAAEITMVAIILGTITANVLNIYSGAMSSLVINIPLRRWQAALLVGALGTVLSWLTGRHDYYTHYENFLFLLGYWVGPWLAVMTVDFLPTRRTIDPARFYDRRHAVGAGFVSWVVGLACSVPFMNQTTYVGFVAHRYPQLGDCTYFVGFVVAGLVYLLIRRQAPVSAVADADAVAAPGPA